MSHLWVSIEPGPAETRLTLSLPRIGSLLRARLPPLPHDPRGLALFLEALVAVYGLPCTAVLDADAEDVSNHPERWARLLGELDDEQVSVEWVALPAPSGRDRFLGAIGDFSRAGRLVSFAATGRR